MVSMDQLHFGAPNCANNVNRQTISLCWASCTFIGGGPETINHSLFASYVSKCCGEAAKWRPFWDSFAFTQSQLKKSRLIVYGPRKDANPTVNDKLRNYTVTVCPKFGAPFWIQFVETGCYWLCQISVHLFSISYNLPMHPPPPCFGVLSSLFCRRDTAGRSFRPPPLLSIYSLSHNPVTVRALFFLSRWWTLGDSVGPLQSDVAHIKSLGPHLGLQLNSSKSEIISSNTLTISTLLSSLPGTKEVEPSAAILLGSIFTGCPPLEISPLRSLLLSRRKLHFWDAWVTGSNFSTAMMLSFF